MRTLSVVLMLLGMASAFGASTYLDRLYATTRPTAADPASGRTYLLSVRGGEDVYVTGAEHWLWFGSLAGGTLLSIAGAILFERGLRGGRGAV